MPVNTSVMWDIWNDGTSTATTVDQYWPIWAQVNSTHSIKIQWKYWSQNLYQQQLGNMQQRTIRNLGYNPPEPRVRTAAEIAEQDARIAHYREIERATQRRIADALERAETLLLQHLTWAQRREYKKHRHITVRSQTGRKFRLRGDHASGNIILLNEKGEGTSRYCAHPRDVPMPDVLLSQIYHLRHNEAEFLGRANRHF